MPSDTILLPQRLAEAARYALMRRLLPAICHDIAGTLQPISMMAAILDKRLQSETPNMAQLGKNTQAMLTMSRQAAITSSNLMTWLAPKDGDRVALGTVVGESLGLVSTELSFRGFSIANKTADLKIHVPQGMIRSVFTASLIALTDVFDGSALIVIEADMTDAGMQLKIMLEAGGNHELAGLGRTPNYRSLGWDDVQELADAEGVSLSRGANFVQLLHTNPADLD
jgi:hypothetical protein